MSILLVTRPAAIGVIGMLIVAASALIAGPAASASSSSFSVTASRETLASGPSSPVTHDNEVMALAPHAGRLFAATDQWEYDGAPAAGQILVKDSARGRWRIFERTGSLRVQALDSFAVPRVHGLGRGHALLITQAIVDGRSRIQWLLDGARRFTHSYALASLGADVRAFGAHESAGRWAVYAGVTPTGILRGTWSPTRHTLVFDPTPELTAAAPRSTGRKTQKVTGFADCAGALYVTINTGLYRRNDGGLLRGEARWVHVYEAPPVGSFNSGLRGLSCVRHRGAPALLVSTEGNGNVYRFDHLPRGQIQGSPTVTPGHGVTGLTPVFELSTVPALRRLLAAQGTETPNTGPHSIDYVISAYNNFESVRLDGATRQLFGIEHAYLGGCPPTRHCGPTAFGAASFDSAACFAIRTDHGASVSYQLRCLAGPAFRTVAVPGRPIRGGQAFVSIRTIVPSPFTPGRLYYGGYDCNFYPADGTAWMGRSTDSALHLGAGTTTGES